MKMKFIWTTAFVLPTLFAFHFAAAEGNFRSEQLNNSTQIRQDFDGPRGFDHGGGHGFPQLPTWTAGVACFNSTLGFGGGSAGSPCDGSQIGQTWTTSCSSDTQTCGGVAYWCFTVTCQ